MAGQPGGWRSFWQRPIFFILGGIVCLLLSGALFVDSLRQVHDRTEMADAPLCSADLTEHCLEAFAGFAYEGYSRGPGSDWRFERLGEGREYQSVDVSTVGSRQLRRYETSSGVWGLYWNDELVAFQLPNSEVVESQDFGRRGSAFYISLSLLVLGMGLVPIFIGITGRRIYGSWWSRGALVDMTTYGRRSNLMIIAFYLFVPAGSVMMALGFGAQPWICIATGVVGLAAATLVTAYNLNWRRRTPEQARANETAG